MNTLFDKIWDKHVVQMVEDGPTQLYIDRMNNQKEIDQRMAAQGITGGAAESTLLGLGTQYEDALRQGVDIYGHVAVEVSFKDDVPGLEPGLLPVGVAVGGEGVAGLLLAAKEDGPVSGSGLEGLQLRLVLRAGGREGGQQGKYTTNG